MLRVLVILSLFASSAWAEDENSILHNSGLPIPRFVTLKSSEVNIRVGPGKDYPIAWVFKRAGYPVEIIEEFGHWRKIRDREDAQGWVHFQLLSGKRSGIVLPAPDHTLVPIYSNASNSSRIKVEAESGVVLPLTQCDKKWCEVKREDINGWIEQHRMWGVYEGEAFEE